MKAKVEDKMFNVKRVLELWQALFERKPADIAAGKRDIDVVFNLMLDEPKQAKGLKKVRKAKKAPGRKKTSKTKPRARKSVKRKA